MRAAKLIGVLVVVLLIAGCGTLVVIPGKTEQLLRTTIKSHFGHVASDVHCPDGVHAKKGNTFDCHFVFEGKKYVAHMHILRVKGTEVDYHIDTELASG